MFCAWEEPNQKFIANGVIGSTKNNKHIKKLINNIESMEHSYERLRKVRYVTAITGTWLVSQLKNDITVFPSTYFYPVLWNGITNIAEHTAYQNITNSFMFQYGYTTNNLKAQIDKS